MDLIEQRVGYDETIEFIEGSDVDAIAPAIGSHLAVFSGMAKDFE